MTATAANAETDRAADAGAPRWVAPLLIGAVVAATLYRLAPLALGPDALARFFVTEDGYLMLTVARNVALGNGLSVAEGTIVTNGVQPLATFLFAIPYWITGGDKTTSLIGVIAISAAWSVGGFLAVRALAARLLRPQTADPLWPLLTATLWFVGPLALFHSMNALETGLYVMMVALTAAVFADLMARPGPYARRDQILFGALCGLTFLARIDGAFLVAALFLARFVAVQSPGRAGGPLSFGQAVREALPPGLISLAFAAPWLIYNYWLFGSIVPISGTAQSVTAELGQNLRLIPAALFETMAPFLPIPGGVQRAPVVQGLTAVVVAAVLAAFLWGALRRGGPARPTVVALTLYAAAIIGYYGALFGAPHFISRYFAPLAPLLIIAGLSAALALAQALTGAGTGARGPGARGARALAIAGAAAVALSAAQLARLAWPGVRDQGHFQVVAWIADNAPADAWVGAVQTGTLGYWRDRTLNLDGKVNPEALRAIIDDGHVLGYVMRSPVVYVADWADVGRAWSTRTEAGFADAFDLIVLDPERNLSVMRRRDG